MTLSIRGSSWRPERRVLFEQPGEVAVQGVGRRGEHEEHQSPGVELVLDQGEDTEGQHQPADGQRVRDVPEPAVPVRPSWWRSRLTHGGAFSGSGRACQ